MYDMFGGDCKTWNPVVRREDGKKKQDDRETGGRRQSDDGEEHSDLGRKHLVHAPSRQFSSYSRLEKLQVV